MSIYIKETDLFQEIELYHDGVKIGEAEIGLKNHCLERLAIYEPYQNKGYGTEIVKLLMEKYGCDNLWVRADNTRAIHVYEKCGFEKSEAGFWIMRDGRKNQ